MSKLPYVWWCNHLTDVECVWREDDFGGRAFVRGLKREAFNGFSMVRLEGRRFRYTKENIEDLVVEILPRLGQDLRDDVEGPISLVPIPNSGMAIGAKGPFRSVELALLVAAGFGRGCRVVPALRWNEPRDPARKNDEHRHPEIYEPHLRVVEQPDGPVVLFDDVLTSGSQMIAAARVLTKAGHPPKRGLLIAKTTKARLAGKLFARRGGKLELMADPFKIDEF
jgi:hypothetical protein